MSILTLGYEGYTIDEFIQRLTNEKINVLADIRHNPWSWKKGFKKAELEASCAKAGIEYLWFPQLGIPGRLRKSVKTHYDLQDLFKRYEDEIQTKKEDLSYLKTIAHDRNVALLCFEKKPEDCHRHILGIELKKTGTEVVIS